MKFKSIKLINYIGIYNGMDGLREIYIDFSKCRNNTIIIRGANGSGKTTLFKALNPLPDSNDSFIPGCPASKEIEIWDNNILYYIRIIHNIKNNGDRDTTKAYVYRIVNGQQVDLNPNGNISSFKDIIYEEFNLDSNFIALSQLSTEDRGLGDKKPAERKTFVNSIVETLEVYNDIYKTITKKASVYKSMINSITSKLDSIGDEVYINNRLNSLEKEYNSLENIKMKTLELITTSKVSLENIDPNNDIIFKYNTLSKELKQLEIEYNNRNEALSNVLKEYNISKEELHTISDNIDKEIDNLELDIQISNSTITNLWSDINTIKKDIEDKKIKIDNLKTDIQYKDINILINDYTNKINNCKNIFNTINIDPNINISKDEYIIGLNTLKDIKEIIDVFKADREFDIINDTINNYIIPNTYPDLISVTNKLDNLNNEYNILTSDLVKWETVKEVASKLSMRHPKCKFNDCEFISDAVIANDKNPENAIIEVSSRLIQINKETKELTNLKELYTKITYYINHIKNIIRYINNNKSILVKLPNGEIYNDSILFFKTFLSGTQSFDYIDNLYRYIDYANVFEDYKVYNDNLSSLLKEKELYDNKNSIIDSMVDDLNVYIDKSKVLEDKLNKEKNNIVYCNNGIQDLNNKLYKINTIINQSDNIQELYSKILDIKNSINELSININAIQEIQSTIEKANFEMGTITRNLSEIVLERDKCKYSSQLAIEYKKEIEEYRNNFNLLETIKFYSSPTTGIQLIFMELYMSKILILVNELLQLIFEGRFVIQNFIINDKEFKIPCWGNGMINDDISSLSNGEMSMISMILNFSILYHSSSKYNILKLDEIDAPLDTYNRRQFSIVLEKLMSILNSEQCIMISHNTEAVNNDVDIILLKTYNEDYVNGNVIFRYK